MNELKAKKLIDEYLETIELDRFEKTKKLFVIGFIGLVGTGKTTAAQKLGEKLNIYVDGGDRVRCFLSKKNIEDESLKQEMVLGIGEAVIDLLYKKRLSHIIDTDLIKYHEMIGERAKNNQAEFLLIQLECPEEVVLERIKKRKEQVKQDPQSNWSQAGKDKYFERKQLHELLQKPECHYTIDTSLELDAQLDGFIQLLKERGLF